MEDCYVAVSQRSGCDAKQGNVFRASSHIDSRDSSPAGCRSCRRVGENARASPGAWGPSRGGIIEATGEYSVQMTDMWKMTWGLLSVRLGIQTFGSAAWHHPRRDDTELRTPARPRVCISRLR